MLVRSGVGKFTKFTKRARGLTMSTRASWLSVAACSSERLCSCTWHYIRYHCSFATESGDAIRVRLVPTPVEVHGRNLVAARDARSRFCVPSLSLSQQWHASRLLDPPLIIQFAFIDLKNSAIEELRVHFLLNVGSFPDPFKVV
jgi:hypothetical protein